MGFRTLIRSLANSNMPKILVDFLSGGHHNFYLETALKAKGTSGFVGSEELGYSEKLLDSLSLVYPVSKTNSCLRRYKILYGASRNLKEDHSFFCLEADQLTTIAFICLLLGREPAIRGTRIGGIWFRSNFLYRKGIVAELKKRILLSLLAKWSSRSGLKYLDDHLAAIIELKLGKQPGSLWCREPYSTTKRAEAKDQLSKQANLLFAGAHAPRKGTAWAVDTIACSYIDPSEISIHIIGEILDDAVIPAVEKARTRGFSVTLNDQFVTSEEYRAAFKDADIVMLPYQDFGGSSGVLIEAAQFQRPFIATNRGTIGRIAGGASATNTFSECSHSEFISSVQQTLASYSKSDWVSRFDAILARCSLQAFQAHVSGSDT